MYEKWCFQMTIDKIQLFKKNLLKNVIVNQWCEILIQRFKKRDVTILKKLQFSIYIFIDVRNDKTSRVYVQNIFRHVKTFNYDFTYHQLFNVWNDFELKFRVQISKFIFDIQLNIFFELLNSKITIWMKMIFKRSNVEIKNFDINNVDKSNRLMNKQNRERQNDFFQQFDVNDFFFSILIFFELHFVSISKFRLSKTSILSIFRKTTTIFFCCVICDDIFSSIFANNFRKRVRFETSKSNFEIITKKFIKRRKIRQQSKQKTNLRRRWKWKTTIYVKHINRRKKTIWILY